MDSIVPELGAVRTLVVGRTLAAVRRLLAVVASEAGRHRGSGKGRPVEAGRHKGLARGQPVGVERHTGPGGEQPAKLVVVEEEQEPQMDLGEELHTRKVQVLEHHNQNRWEPAQAHPMASRQLLVVEPHTRKAHPMDLQIAETAQKWMVARN